MSTPQYFSTLSNYYLHIFFTDNYERTENKWEVIFNDHLDKRKDRQEMIYESLCTFKQNKVATSLKWGSTLLYVLFTGIVGIL